MEVPMQSKPNPPSTVDRLLAKRTITTDGCWEWSAGHTPDGYGQMSVAGKVHYVHRLAHELWKGPIPEGLQIDHLCRNRGCFNPEHLEAVTGRENVRRSFEARGVVLSDKPTPPRGEPARPWPRTHCPQGHPFDEANTYWRPKPGGGKYRTCRTCRAAAQRRRLQRIRADGERA
jgi:hypothetical protein